jgi:CheY-like chemotaxis protein
MLEQQAADSQVTIELNFSPTMPLGLYGDEKCLKQIIINLLSNSIKFTHHGKVVISAEYSKSNHLILSVWDDGIGITKQQQLKIFDRFCQGDSSVYSRYGGSGLGLAICRQLANLMGGEITVDSRVGKYCSFTIDLPLAVRNETVNTAENSENVELKELSSLLPSNRELIVLGVDDNEINRRVLSAMLKKLGHRMIEATSGQQAIDIARSGQALDLILMDCEMPGMNGFEATEVIRKWQHGQAGEDCPIVALTAHVLTEHIEKCLAAGMNAHLSKPLHLNQLRELLESLGAENK